MLPGVHDTLSALVAEFSGAKALAAGGYSATAALLGRPDSSQLSLTELADFYARITERVSVPLLADADTGFGNVTNVARTVRMMERAGVGAFFIEDQVYPKRCGHMAGKAVVAVDEMAGKLKAALDSRQEESVMIMARTDAIATDGLQAALDRMALYCEIGADILFVEAPHRSGPVASHSNRAGRAMRGQPDRRGGDADPRSWGSFRTWATRLA